MNVEQFIAATANGKIFTVEFIKRTTGERRVMNCRRGVKKNLTGEGRKFDAKSKNLLGVYDLQKIEANGSEKGAYRLVNLEELISLKLEGKKYVFDKEKDVFVEA